MAYTNTTSNLGLPQFAETDVPTWEDVNTAFKKIDDYAGTVNEKISALEGSVGKINLKDFIKYDSEGTGITASQYGHLTVNQ